MNWDGEEGLTQTRGPATVLVLAGAAIAWFAASVLAGAVTVLHAVIDRSPPLVGPRPGEDL